MKLQNRIVVITGASSGIGAEMAKQFADKGAQVILTARSYDKLQAVASTLKSGADIYMMDVTDTNSVMDTFSAIMQRYGRIDVLINNAGYAFFENFMDAPMDHFENMMNVNYMGIVRCTKAVLPGMLSANHGHIVNIASVAGKIGTAKSTAYSASKHAVLGFTNSLRLELAGTDVFLTAINPGPIDTPFFDKADPSGQYVKAVSAYMLKPKKVAYEVVHAVEHRVAEKKIGRAHV
jgi:short-subunit dehydrogenase